eukprot:sb/3464555/
MSEEVEETLSTYLTQLSQVQDAISADPSNSDLKSLETDLKEIISLTENELMNLKKNELLRKLNDSTPQQEEVVEEEKDGEGLDSFIGMKCSIMYQSSWGSLEQHNCVVLSVAMPDDPERAAEVTLLFLTPTSQDMVPCNHFLNSTCTYDPCRYSHGHKTTISELIDYREPNFDGFVAGRRCLCKNSESGLWSPGTVTGVGGGNITAKLDGSGREVDLGYDEVYPLTGTQEINSDDGDDVGATFVPIPAPEQKLNFGGWEEHTNSFGSRMMVKMGYKFGEGLGRHGTGKIDPVEIDIIPIGASLDRVRELRERKLIRTVYKLNAILERKMKEKTETANAKIQKAASMFTTLDAITRNRDKGGDGEKGKNKKPIRKVCDKSVRVKSVSLDQDISKCKQRIKNLNLALGRRRTDEAYCSHLRVKLREEKESLEKLLGKQRTVENELKFRSDKKKLKIF